MVDDEAGAHGVVSRGICPISVGFCNKKAFLRFSLLDLFRFSNPPCDGDKAADNNSEELGELLSDDFGESVSVTLHSSFVIFSLTALSSGSSLTFPTNAGNASP